MKTLVISKPIYDYILPLVEFPEDGDKFFINNSIRTISNIGSLIAITLASYGIDVSYTGVIGEDEIGRKIKEKFDEYKIDTKYIETSYTEKTCTNYKIYNSKSNKFTTIVENSIKNNLTKYKYEFIPDVVVMDDGDYNANLAAINNYPNAKLIYIGEKFTKDTLVYCNKCNYVISSLSFASEATGIVNNLNKPKTIVSLFQKFIDLYSANLIIKLDNFDILYCVNDEVRLIKNVNKNITNKDNVYYSVLTYFLINTNDVENSIKYTNKVMLSSLSELDMIKNIPNYNEIKNIIDNIQVNTQTVSEVSNSSIETLNNTETSNTNNANTNDTSVNDTNETIINTPNEIPNNINEQTNVANNNINNTQIEQPKLNNNIQNVNTTNEGVNNVETL